jgi:hypothetical protein
VFLGEQCGVLRGAVKQVPDPGGGRIDSRMQKYYFSIFFVHSIHLKSHSIIYRSKP